MDQMQNIAAMTFHLFRTAELSTAHKNMLLIFVGGSEFQNYQQRETEKPSVYRSLEQYSFDNL